MDIPKSGLFAHLDKYLPATLPPLLCLTVEIQQYYVTFANRDVIDTSTSLNDILRLLKNHFDEFYSPFLMKLLHKRSRGSGTLVKLSLIILHYPSLSTQILVDKCTINRELREGMDLLNAGEHIFPGCNVEVELRIIQWLHISEYLYIAIYSIQWSIVLRQIWFTSRSSTNYLFIASPVLVRLITVAKCILKDILPPIGQTPPTCAQRVILAGADCTLLLASIRLHHS